MIDLYIEKCQGNPSDAAHKLLHKLLKENYHISEPIECRTDYGKPYLINGPYIGISHSRGWLVVGIGDVMFGVDLEVPRKIQRNLASRVFSASELIWYQQQGCSMDAFLSLWTLKESYYKYLGTGLPGFPNQTEFVYDGRWKLKYNSCCFSLHKINELRIAVCSHTEQKMNFIYL